MQNKIGFVGVGQCGSMLLAGTEKENFTLLKEELMPYDIEDGLELESFTSLNLINCKNKYIRFISKLPPPIK